MSTIPFRDKIIPWYFVMFFVVIALMNAVMITIAFRTHTGLVTEHPYEKGIAYNQTIEAAAKQAALGWSSTIAYAEGKLRFAVKDKAGAALSPEKTTANFMRPTQDGMDFSVVLNEGEAAVTFPAKGLWEVRVNSIIRGIHYQQTQRLVIP
jgi:nitrogen fixation protein FixH